MTTPRFIRTPACRDLISAIGEPHRRGDLDPWGQPLGPEWLTHTLSGLEDFGESAVAATREWLRLRLTWRPELPLHGRFELVNHMATGNHGSSLVYRAMDLETGADVAIKRYSVATNTDALAVLYRNEVKVHAVLADCADMARALDHDDDECWIAKELVPGSWVRGAPGVDACAWRVIAAGRDAGIACWHVFDDNIFTDDAGNVRALEACSAWPWSDGDEAAFRLRRRRWAWERPAVERLV